MRQVLKKSKSKIKLMFIATLIVGLCNSSDYLLRIRNSTLLSPEKQIAYDIQNNLNANVHPRLLIDNSSLKRIKKLIIVDHTMHNWYIELYNSTNEILKTVPVTYKLSNQRLLLVSRTVLQRIINLSLMYQLTGEEKYAHRGWEELKTVTDDKTFPDWHPAHFLDTAEMVNAVAIGYDWLYDYLSTKERKRICKAIISKALKPALKVYTGHADHLPISSFWRKTNSNWNAVCNSGIGMGALAIADKYPKLSGRVLYYVVKSLKKSLSAFSPDGGMPEGPMYWNYATRYISFLLSSFESYLGKNYGLINSKGFLKTAFYPIYMTGDLSSFNIGDGDDQRNTAIPQMFWFANKLKNSTLYFYALSKIKYDPLNLIWYKPMKMDSSKIASLPLGKNFINGSTGISVMRNNWEDNAMFVGIHWGENKISHSDLDIGDFVIDSNGIRWATELGADNYNLPNYFDNNEGRWKYYRKRAEGQNTLVINPGNEADQSKDGEARLVRGSSSTRQGFVIIDMTNAYKKEALSIYRGIALTRNRSAIVIEDELRLKRRSIVYWFMHTPAQIALSRDKKTAILLKNGKEMFAKIISPSNGEFRVMDAKPLSTSPNPDGQSKNFGIKKLTIFLNNIQNARISVVLSQDNNILNSSLLRPLDKWTQNNLFD